MMSNTVKVSVITPVYNVASYLERYFDSVMNQTLKEIEIICINDASTDHSLEILREYESREPRMKVINFTDNKNAANALNAGLEVATGEYLGFVDPDDCIDLNFYEKLYNASQSENADIVKGQLKKITLDGKVFLSSSNKIIKENNTMAFCNEWTTAIYKHSLVVGNHIKFPAECPTAWDIVFLTRCVIKAKKLVFVDDIYYHYYRREGSLDSRKMNLRSIESSLYARKLIFDELSLASAEEVDEEGYLYACFHHLIEIITHVSFKNDSLECRQMCAQSLVENYHRCKNKTAIDKKMFVSAYDHILHHIKNSNVEEIADELYKISSIPNYVALKKLRVNIKRDLKRE